MSDAVAATTQSDARSRLWLAGRRRAAAGLVGANAHLVYVAMTSQPDCVAHVRQGEGARSADRSARRNRPATPRRERAAEADMTIDPGRRSAAAARSRPGSATSPAGDAAFGWLAAGWRDLHASSRSQPCLRRAASSWCRSRSSAGCSRSAATTSCFRPLPASWSSARSSPSGSTKRAAASRPASRSACGA